jgi:hypothetical protein
MEICTEVFDNLNQFSFETSLEDLKQASVGLLGAMYNTIGALSSSIMGMNSALKTDINDAIKPENFYDNDLENPLLNPSI